MHGFQYEKLNCLIILELYVGNYGIRTTTFGLALACFYCWWCQCSFWCATSIHCTRGLICQWEREIQSSWQPLIEKGWVMVRFFHCRFDMTSSRSFQKQLIRYIPTLQPMWLTILLFTMLMNQSSTNWALKRLESLPMASIVLSIQKTIIQNTVYPRSMMYHQHTM